MTLRCFGSALAQKAIAEAIDCVIAAGLLQQFAHRRAPENKSGPWLRQDPKVPTRCRRGVLLCGKVGPTPVSSTSDSSDTESVRSQKEHRRGDTAVCLLTPKVDISYTVVGDGDDLPRLKNLADDLGLRSQVHFRGRVDQEDLLSLLFRSRSLHPGLQRRHARRRGFRDRLYRGLCRRNSSDRHPEGRVTDAVQEGVNGLIIPDPSPESIARGIDATGQKGTNSRPRESEVSLSSFDGVLLHRSSFAISPPHFDRALLPSGHTRVQVGPKR